MRRSAPLPRAFLAAVSALLVSSCGGSDGGGGDAGPTGPDLNAVANVAVNPSSGTVDVGATLQLSATVTNVEGSPLNSTVSWSSSASAVATVNSAGLVTGVAAGSATITASAGGRSGSAQVTVNDPNPPAAPTELSATATSNTEVDLSWTDNANNETGFSIEREPLVQGASRASGQTFAEVGTVGADATSFTDTGLSSATGYRYRVRARNANGDSDYTNTAEVTTHAELVLVTTALDDGLLNQSYSVTLQATGGTGSFTWSLTSGTLPAGLSLSEDGVISGTPTAEGTSSIQITVASGGQSVARDFTLTVNEQIFPPEVVTTALPDGAVGAAYSAKLQAQRGDGTYAWAQTGGTLPAGLTLASDGTVSGTPTAAGTSSFTVQVTSAELTGSGDVSITILPKLEITTTALANGTEGTAYSAMLAATGGDGSYTWSAVSALPDGLSLSAGGTLSGTPTAPGTFALTFQVESGDGQTATKELSLTIVGLLSITTTSLDNGQVGTSYSATLSATGGSGTKTWSVSSGSLPAGLSLGGSGVITGIPGVAGTSTFTVQVASADGQTAAQELTLTVDPGPVTITTESLPDGQIGTAYSATLAAAGGDGTTYAWALTSGQLPAGLSLNASTGEVSGTPTTAESQTFTVTATSGGQSGAKEFTVTIAALPPVVVTTESLAAGRVGFGYSATLTATGGDGTNYVWSITSGALPGGLALSAGGTISGTPTADGTFNFTVQAESGGQTGTKDLAITITAGFDNSKYNITLVYLTSLSSAHQAVFEAARTRWEAIITADLANVTSDIPACNTSEGEFHPATEGGVDDIVIYVRVKAIDGPGNTLGQAGPCYIHGNQLPLTGAMEFDEADLDVLLAQGLLSNTILHEMGHVLGIGTVWTTLGLLSGECLADPIFTGANAIAAFDAAGGTAYTLGGKVPVENTGALNDGSNCAHWRESVFATELMTPILDGATDPLSAVTIQSLADEGYTVDVGQADGFALPAPSSVAQAPLRRRWALVNDVLPTPLYMVHPDGRIELVRAPSGRR